MINSFKSINFVKKLKYLFVFGFLSLSFINLLNTNTAFAQVFFQVQDTGAGENASVFISGLSGLENISVEIEKPNDDLVLLDLVADESGIIRDSIYGLHLHHSGEYLAKLWRFDGEYMGAQTDFEINSGIPSAFQTKINFESTLAPADGTTALNFTLDIKDAYKNTIKKDNVNIKILSSRSADTIFFDSKTGQGHIKSSTPGVSIISVLLDETILFEKPELVFHLDSAQSGLGSVGAGEENESGIGSFLKAQLFEDEFSEVRYFSLEGLNSELFIGRNYSLTVVAMDENGNIVPDYLGKVRFASSDAQAILPPDYTFTREDQGKHAFSLALTFATPGEQTLTIVDSSNSQVEGTMDLNLISNETDPVQNNGRIEIITPTAGTYNSSRMTISGNAPSSSTIDIVDGPTVLIESLVVGNDGSFVYETPTLADGLHRFKVFSSDKKLESEDISVRIDKTPPRTLAVKITPQTDIEAGSTFTISVSSDEELSAVSCDFNGITQDLRPSGEGFEATFQAPNTSGELPIGCKISDLIGNELEETQAAVVKIVGASTEPVNPPTIDPEPETEPENPIPDPKPEVIAPTAVSGLSLQPADDRITLFWSPATDDSQIKQYKINFGTNREQLTSQNMTPDNRTQWYVSALEPGTKYYFQVLAIDDQGNEGALSQIVESTTLGGDFRSAAVPTAGFKSLLPYLLAFGSGILFLILSYRRKI